VTWRDLIPSVIGVAVFLIIFAVCDWNANRHQ
jgi:hypothetical protein